MEFNTVLDGLTFMGEYDSYMTELQSALASNRCKCQHLTVAFSWVLNLCIEL